MMHGQDDGCPICVMCGRHRIAAEHVDTCGKRCFRALRNRQIDLAIQAYNEEANE